MINYFSLFSLSFISIFYFLNLISDKKLLQICCFFCVIRIFDNIFAFSFFFSLFIPLIFYSKFFLSLNSKLKYLADLIKKYRFLFLLFAFNLYISSLIAFFFHDNTDFSLVFFLYSVIKNSIRFGLILLFIRYIIDNKKFLQFGLHTILFATLFSISTEIFTFIYGHNLQPVISNLGYNYNLSSGLKSFRMTGLSFEPRYMAFLCIFCMVFLFLHFKNKEKIPNKLEMLAIFCFLSSLVLTFSFSGYIFTALVLCSFFFAYKNFIILHLRKIVFFGGMIIAVISFLVVLNPNLFWQITTRLGIVQFHKFNYFPTFFNFFEHHDKLAIVLLDSNPLFLLSGMGFSMIKFFDANIEYARFGEPTLTRINFPSVSDCCDPGTGFILSLSSFGIFVTLFFAYKLFSYLNQDNKNIWAYMSIIFFLILPPGPLTLMVISLAIINYKQFKLPL
jgi:hypothetical protein